MPRYRFGDIAFNSVEKKKPTAIDKATYLGLEHLDSGNLTVERFGTDVTPLGEKLLMKKGDVLFGKRRAYQKKVAIAPFDGIFSAHGMVLRPKTNVITEKFFPLFIASDYFLDAAIKISVGSLSPTINWSALKDLEFNLPTVNEQQTLSEVLWAMIEVKNAYKKLIFLTEQLVKSRFVEMFGEIVNSSRLGDVCEISRGGSPRPISEFITEGENGINWIKIGDADESRYITKTKQKIKPEGMKKSRYVESGDLILSNSMSFGRPYILKINGCIHDGWLVLHFGQERLNSIFLQTYLDLPSTYAQFENMAAGAVVNNLNSDVVKQLPIPLPSLPLQTRFAAFAEAADKSTFAMTRALDKLDSAYKALVRERLG